jgi:hypothetical protein
LTLPAPFLAAAERRLATGEALQADGSMRLQRYVDGVEGHAAGVRADRLASAWRYCGGYAQGGSQA